MSELIEYIKEKQGADIISINDVKGETVLNVEASKLHQIIKFLRDDDVCKFQQLMDICGADYPERNPRFEVVYHLLSLKHNHRIRVKASTAEDIASINDLYDASGWYERETFDMYGVKFTGSPDLRRILTDYNFEGFPLRKDFPLVGEYDVFYSEAEQKVVRDKVKLNQEYREFDFVPERNQSHDR